MINSELSDLISQYSQVIIAGVAFYGLIYAIRQYQLSRSRYLEESRPYIQIELERAVSGLFNLSIRNAGNSAAKNICVRFKPNIILHDYSKTRINNYKFLKNMKFLASGKTFSFFFGSIIGGNTNICREFEVAITYSDLSNRKYQDTQLIDPRDYLEVTQIDRKDVHDVAKSLIEIKDILKKNVDVSESVVDVLQNGLTSRDAVISKLDYSQTLILLLNIITIGKEGEYNPYPFTYDAKYISKLARDHLLAQSKINKDDEEMVKILNSFQRSEYGYKQEEIQNQAAVAIRDYLSKNGK